MPQQFLVPLFQRRYTWSEGKQWDPLWRDVQRVADRLLDDTKDKVHPHFLGAVVLQQVENPTGSLQERTIIDGQQRLTTLQLLMDAVQGELLKVNALQPAARLGTLIENGAQFCQRPEDRFKLRPTHEDRPAFDAVMDASHPINYENLRSYNSKFVEAHEFFAANCRVWLDGVDQDKVGKRGETIEKVLREYLQLVVIDLTADENSQEIFETLNSRGEELTAADLIKNFVFQRLRPENEDADIEEIYNSYWRDFDRLAFWNELENLGRLSQKRSSAFLGYWLTAQTGDETVLGEVFQRFKSLVLYGVKIPMFERLKQIRVMADKYRVLVESANKPDGQISRVELFMYRSKALESNLVKTVVLALVDPQRSLHDSQINGALDVVESWMARRTLLLLTSKAYNRVFADVVNVIRNTDPQSLVSAVERFFTSQQVDSTYWPDDAELLGALAQMSIYRKRRARNRMILESLEDYDRGWTNAANSSGGNPRVLRGTYSIEHLMPQGWQENWPLNAEFDADERGKRIDVLGNLTLVTNSLNSGLSNRPWSSKTEILHQRDIGLMNKHLIASNPDSWAELDIDQRTMAMALKICKIWPVPAGHKVVLTTKISKLEKRYVWVADLLNAGLLQVGQILYPNQGKYAGRNAILTAEGQIEIDGKVFSSPSGAGYYIRQRATNGWDFWLVDPDSKSSLKNLRAKFIADLGPDVDVEDDDISDDEEAEDS